MNDLIEVYLKTYKFKKILLGNLEFKLMNLLFDKWDKSYADNKCIITVPLDVYMWYRKLTSNS